MEATNKGKICIVALIHFFASILIFIFGTYTFSGYWKDFWIQLGIAAQPQQLLVYYYLPEPAPLGALAVPTNQNLLNVIGLVLIITFFVSIPLWSICFGWIFVKLDNWLNHFPVLGKRVF
jgi:hypothetical protein